LVELRCGRGDCAQDEKENITRRMAFTFIHTADWQLGAQFGALPGDVAARLQAARFDAIDRIAAVAMEHGAGHVLVAGDVFDTVRPPQRLIGQTLARLAKYRGLVWHLLPGNHDPAQPGSVWEDLARALPGPHVRLHIRAEPFELATGVILIPAPLTAKAMSHDPTAFMDQIETPPGAIRIGMAHGSVRGFSSEGEAAIPIAPERVVSARLDYLALGDWHGAVRVNPRVWYSGTPEPDRYRDNAPGHALAVSIAAPGAVPTVRQIATAGFRWQQHSLDITSVADVDRVAEAIGGGVVSADKTLLKLVIEGRVPLAEAAAVERSLEALAAAVAHLAVDRTGLIISTSEADLEALGTGAIATVAAHLSRQTRSGDAEQQAIANRALQLLTRFAGASS
jgi:DNA repair exonuclease SbcCD nuclease subunit